MTCKKCNSGNIEIQIVSNVKSNGVIPLWYWCSFLWCIDWMLFFRIAKKAKRRTYTKIEK